MVEKPKVPKATDLTYGSYLKVSELITLQEPESDPIHHDEMLFIVIHQTYELWFRLILWELEKAIEYMNKNKILRARHFVERVVAIMKVLVKQIHILETMTPAEFTQFRNALNPASGFQSAQFREFEFICGAKDPKFLRFFKNDPEATARLEKRLESQDLRHAYYEMLMRIGFDMPEAESCEAMLANPDLEEGVTRQLVAIYEDPEKHMSLFLLTEALVSLDQYLVMWREHHVHVVERVIGFKKGTGGSEGVGYLRTTLSKKCFPYLWAVRSLLGEIKP